MSKSNAGTIALVAAAGIGAYLLYGKFGGIGKGIKETVDNVTETAKTVYDNPVSDSARTILDDAGIIDKEDTISTIVTSKPLATNPLQAFTGIANLFATGIKNATDTAGKAISNGFDTIVVENVKNLGTTISGNPINSIVNFVSGLLNQNKDTNTNIKERETMPSTKASKLDLSAYDTDKNGVKLTSAEKFANWSMGIDPSQVEIVGRQLTEKEKAEMATNPPKTTKSLEEYAQEDNFMGRVARYVLARKK